MNILLNIKKNLPFQLKTVLKDWVDMALHEDYFYSQQISLDHLPFLFLFKKPFIFKNKESQSYNYIFI